MARVKGGVHAKKKHKSVLKRAKGFRGARSRRFRTAKEAVFHAERYAYRDRRRRKGDFRRLWITRINAAARMDGLSYSRFMHGLKLAEVDVDRKNLADLAVREPATFSAIVDVAKGALGMDVSAPASGDGSPADPVEDAPTAADADEEAAAEDAVAEETAVEDAAEAEEPLAADDAEDADDEDDEDDESLADADDVDSDADGVVNADDESPFGAASARAAEDGSGPEGWTIKGNADSMLYHTEDSPYWSRTKAEVWFETEEDAEAAGFTAWNASDDD